MDLRTRRRYGADALLVAAPLAGLLAVAVIRTTMLPSVGSWDTAEAQTVVTVLGTMHPTGFPAYVILGWLASVLLRPLGSPAFVANLLSALLVGAATAGTVVVARRLGAPLALAVAAGIGFASTPLVWAIGNAADVHALHLVLVVLTVLGLLRWERLSDRRRARPWDAGIGRSADRTLVVTAGVFGLAVANHGLALLLVVPVGLFVLAVEPRIVRRPRLVLASLAACLGVAALLYLELPLRAGPFRAPLVYGHPDTWSGFWDIVLARQFQGELANPLSDLPGRVRDLASLVVAQLGPLAGLVPIGAVVTAVRRPRYALLSITAATVTCAFAGSYVNASIGRYYLGPVFFAWTWLAVLVATAIDLVAPWRGAGRDGDPDAADDGVAWVPRWSRPRAVLAVALAVALLVPTAVALPDRWRSLDRSRETWADLWLDQALGAMQPNAVVISWWSYSTPLWYARLVEGRRQDIEILDDRTRTDLGLLDLDAVIDDNLRTRPVYLIRATPGEIDAVRARYRVEWAGGPANLYRVTGRQETAP